MSGEKYCPPPFPFSYSHPNPYHPQIPQLYDPNASFNYFQNSQYFQGFSSWEQSPKPPEIYHPPNVV